MSKFDTEKDGRLVELYQDHREKLECIGTTFHQNKTRSGWESIAKAINRLTIKIKQTLHGKSAKKRGKI